MRDSPAAGAQRGPAPTDVRAGDGKPARLSVEAFGGSAFRIGGGEMADVLWRSPGVTVRKPPTTVLGRYFGARVTAVRASEVDAKIPQAGEWHTKTFPRSMAATAIAGDPICLELDSETVGAASVVRAIPSRFIGGLGAADTDIAIVPGSVGGQE